jgi:hypothetical protein
MENDIQRKQEKLKTAFEKNIAAKAEAIQKHRSGIESEHMRIKAAQGNIVQHNQVIAALEEEKTELLKEFEEFKETLN